MSETQTVTTESGKVHVSKPGRMPGSHVLACSGRTVGFALPGVAPDSVWCSRCLKALRELGVERPCECSPLERIAGDNAGSPGKVAERVIVALSDVCNACGGRRP